MAKLKLENAFDFFEKLGQPYFCFHDADIAPEGSNFAETEAIQKTIVDAIQKKIEDGNTKLLWGTANLFSHRRYMGGAATNPDPDVFKYAAAQVKMCMDNTKQLGGQNYVLWGGREGYETILNTNMKQELDQLGRFMQMAVEHKYKIGFQGPLLIEPKPHEPSKHQYDFDAAAVYAFLQKNNLEKDIKLNLEVNHATLALHSFEHEIVYAFANNIFGSLDINRGDPLIGWDTDQFPNSVQELLMPFYYIYKNGGLGSGGLNFDAKIRRQSIDPEDLFYAHIGAMDICAKTLLATEKMINDGVYDQFIKERYGKWPTTDAIAANQSLEAIHAEVIDKDINPQPKSGRQEFLENLVNRYLD
jgi:xylose isomerase